MDTNTLKQISPGEENKNIDGFDVVSPQKSLNLSDLKKSLMEVEVMQEAKDNTATSASAKQRKKKARKQRKKRSRAKPYIDPFQTIVVDALYEILHDIVENDDIHRDDPERESLVHDITKGRLTKENLNQKLAEYCARKRCY